MELHLKEIRKEKGIKQEQLADAVGVSPQAVSKWESGGMPDAALLPQIADCLGVSIDTLYGRGKAVGFEEQYMHEIANLPYPQRFRRVYELCRLSAMAVMGETQRNEILDQAAENVYTQITDDSGILLGRIRTEKNPFFMLIPEPAEGFDSVLACDDRLAELFSALGNPAVLKAMFFLQKHAESFFSLSALAAALSVGKEAAGDILSRLLSLGIVRKESYLIDNQSQTIYRFNLNAEFIVLLYFAQLILDPPDSFCYQTSSRTRPFFRD